MTPRFSILAPAARVYGEIVARRRRRFLEKPAARLENCAVISVGNLTVGGTGKTPAVQYVARLLQENGARVAVVSRGYGGALAKHGAIVSDGKSIFHDAREVGDEPLLHARALPGVPVVAGIDRVRAARLALEKFAPDVIVLDDAFQFYSLHRDLNLVLLDARRPLGNGHLLPRGTLREEAAALHRADVLLLTRADRATPQQIAATRETLRAFCNAPLYEAAHAPSKLLRVNFEKPVHANAPREYSQLENARAKKSRREKTHPINATVQNASREYSPHETLTAPRALDENAPSGNASREYSPQASGAARAEKSGVKNALGERENRDDATARGEDEKSPRGENAGALKTPDDASPQENASSRQQVFETENGEYSLDWLHGKTVSAASALADNAAFRATLETLGARVASHCARRDHHKWRDGEIIAAAREGAARGAAALIVTEKDAVKISRVATQKSALPILALGIELRVTRGENELCDLIVQVASTRGARK